MESRNLGYSAKNIPIVSKDVYTKELINKTELFIKRVRWKVYHFLSKNEHDGRETYGFRTTNTPPKNPLLYEFENDLYDMIKNIDYRKVKNDFQSKILNDIKSIRTKEKIYVKADKTRNLYEVEPHEYEKMLSDNITKNYKKAAMPRSPKCTKRQLA